MNASPTQPDQIAKTTFPPTNQATRWEIEDVDEVIVPQRTPLALWCNDVTGTQKRVENTFQNVRVLRDPLHSISKFNTLQSAVEVTSCHGALTASSASHITAEAFAGTTPMQISRKEHARFQPTNQGTERDVDETIAPSSIPATLWRGDRTRIAEHTRSFGRDVCISNL